MRKLVHFIAPILGVIYLPILMTVAALIIAAFFLSLLAIPPVALIFVAGVGVWKSIFISVGFYIAAWVLGVIMFINLDDNNVAWFTTANGKLEAWHRGLLVERPRTPTRREIAETYAVD